MRSPRGPVGRPGRRRLLGPLGPLGLLGAVAVLGACTVVPPTPDGGAPRGATAAAEPTADASPSCVPAPLRERAAAVLVVGIPEVLSPDEPLAREVARLGVGGLFLAHSNVESAEQVDELVAGIRAAAPAPMVVSTDEEGGRVSVTRTLVGPQPSARRVAERGTPQEAEDLGREIGEALHDVGIDVNLAPVLDLDDGPADGIVGDRAYGADPELATRYGLAFAAGLDDAGVTPVVKHFPGHGRSDADTHSASAHVGTPVDELLETDLVPFRAAIDAGAPVVMLNHLRYEEMDRHHPASMSPAVYRLLRDLGFEGVAMTDSVGMGPVHRYWDFPEAAVQGIAAGADAVLATDGSHARAMRDALVRAVQRGELAENRLDVAAARMRALAGGDPVELTCLDVSLPRLDHEVPEDEDPRSRDDG